MWIEITAFNQNQNFNWETQPGCVFPQLIGILFDNMYETNETKLQLINRKQQTCINSEKWNRMGTIAWNLYL